MLIFYRIMCLLYIVRRSQEVVMSKFDHKKIAPASKKTPELSTLKNKFMAK